ncbi:unknown protein [Seminavis robusta]|uniref:Arrestin C-terminal-like domain-containing protein n=1 Tax=Seminavis robusta TaxID=568900 RepID=A0A9N8DSA7_9STRA|nr:unknown protein [Seminavis robusta]|eukprot:Sro306_g113070.1 n/a (332) ;mRNA; f:54584-55579
MDLFFQVDQKSVETGGRLSGCLVIKASKAIAATELSLRFRGKELTTVEGSKGSRCCAEAELVNVGISTAQHGIIQAGHIAAGTHHVPFSIMVPHDLPPTIRLSHRGRDRLIANEGARVEYSLRAVVEGSGILKNYQARKEIRVVAKSKRPRPVQKILTFDGGKITCGLKILDTRLRVGQHPQVQLSIINEGDTVVESIEAKVQQKVRWSAKGECGGGRKAPTYITIKSETLIKQATILDGSSSMDMSSGSVTLQDPQKAKKYKIHLVKKELAGGHGNALVLPAVPSTALNSHCKGKNNIKVDHQILVTISTPERAHSKNLVMAIPVTIAAQ